MLRHKKSPGRGERQGREPKAVGIDEHSYSTPSADIRQIYRQQLETEMDAARAAGDDDAWVGAYLLWLETFTGGAI